MELKCKLENAGSDLVKLGFLLASYTKLLNYAV